MPNQFESETSTGGANLSQYLSYQPKGGKALVKQTQKTVYSESGEELHAVSSVYLAKVNNYKVKSYQNTSSSTQTHSYNVESGYKVISGAQVIEHLGVAELFKGIEIVLESEIKLVESIVSTVAGSIFGAIGGAISGAVHGFEFRVPAGAEVTLYQRKYEYHTNTYYIYKSGGSSYVVGDASGGNRLYSPGHVEVSTKDCTTTTKPLEGYGQVDIKTVADNDYGKGLSVRKYGDTSSKCQSTLKAIGAYGN